MRGNVLSSEPVELRNLRELSARIGTNPLLVQASSGNTSLKIDDVLWIKASGKWFTQAAANDFLIPVRLSRARRCLRENMAIPETAIQFEGACASIETAMHAVLPARVVIHVHSVNTIAWAVREDARQRLGERLSGLDWQWIPYTQSGFALARRIEDVLIRSPETDVWVLGNHGLVVCGEDAYAAERLLYTVEERLAVTPRCAAGPSEELLAEALTRPEWRLPSNERVHALSTDAVSWRILSRGVLYPCQAIFLPGTIPAHSAVPGGSCGGECGCKAPIPLLVEGHGTLCYRGMTQAEQEMLAGLANVVQRIDGSVPLRY